MIKKFLSWLCKHRIERAYYLYLNGDITGDEVDEKRFFWQTLYAKWVRDECHHLCIMCDYKHECWSNAKEL